MSRNRIEDNLIQGHPLTNQRRLLLELLHNTDGHIDAKELSRCTSTKDETISPAMLYRILNLFKELGLVNEMRLGKIRCFSDIKQTSEHQHLVCKGCGKVMEIQNPHPQKLVKAVRREHCFRVAKAELYLESFCPECEKDGEYSMTNEYKIRYITDILRR